MDVFVEPVSDVAYGLGAFFVCWGVAKIITAIAVFRRLRP